MAAIGQQTAVIDHHVLAMIRSYASDRVNAEVVSVRRTARGEAVGRSPDLDDSPVLADTPSCMHNLFFGQESCQGRLESDEGGRARLSKGRVGSRRSSHGRAS
jgi:hypothetical protein